MNRTLDLVKDLAEHLRTVSKENQTLQQEVEQLQQSTTARLDAVERRVTLHDATVAVDSLSDTNDGDATTVSPAAAPRRRPRHADLSATNDQIPPTGLGAEHVKHAQVAHVALPHYAVQAAAPDFAIVTSAAGNMEVHPNDDLPGYGRVQSISLRGDSWVIQTEHGVVR